MKQLLTITCLLILFATKAQYFIPPMDNGEIGMAKAAYVITNEGDSLNGSVGMAMMTNGQLRSFTFKLDGGGKEKFKAADVKVLGVKPNKLSNISSALSVPNLEQLLEQNFDEIVNREWVYFEQALLPKKKDKYALMQLLNPGYDSKIKIYQDPMANETMGVGVAGVQLTGGIAKSYLVVFDGGKSEVYKKSRYKKDALGKLYKDCQIFKDNYAGEKFQWNDFAEHVLVYDQLCTE